MSLDYVSNQEIIQAARRNLPQDVWDYLTGGAESETTMRRNRLGFDSLALRPRVLIDVSKIDTSTTFLGQQLRIPVMLAPASGCAAASATACRPRKVPRQPMRPASSSSASTPASTPTR